MVFCFAPDGINWFTSIDNRPISSLQFVDVSKRIIDSTEFSFSCLLFTPFEQYYYHNSYVILSICCKQVFIPRTVFYRCIAKQRLNINKKKDVAMVIRWNDGVNRKRTDWPLVHSLVYHVLLLPSILHDFSWYNSLWFAQIMYQYALRKLKLIVTDTFVFCILQFFS